MPKSLSFALAKKYLGKEVEIEIDRPLGSKHPRLDFIYEVNYGYLPGVKVPDGDDLDAYYLGINKPLNKAKGVVIAIIHRLKDDDDKLIVAPKGTTFSDNEISKMVNFVEQWFEHQIVR